MLPRECRLPRGPETYRDVPPGAKGGRSVTASGPPANPQQRDQWTSLFARVARDDVRPVLVVRPPERLLRLREDAREGYSAAGTDATARDSRHRCGEADLIPHLRIRLHVVPHVSRVGRSPTDSGTTAVQGDWVCGVARDDSASTVRTRPQAHRSPGVVRPGLSVAHGSVDVPLAPAGAVGVAAAARARVVAAGLGGRAPARRGER